MHGARRQNARRTRCACSSCISIVGIQKMTEHEYKIGHSGPNLKQRRAENGDIKQAQAPGMSADAQSRSTAYAYGRKIVGGYASNRCSTRGEPARSVPF